MRYVAGLTLFILCGFPLAVIGFATLAQVLKWSALSYRVLLSPTIWTGLMYDTFGRLGLNSTFFVEYGPFVALAGLMVGTALGVKLLCE